ncbi:hypothetical protein ACFTSF_09965 [Kribbella sp. NPDC056951]|uniref:hypothetical protein n=1 Tax=Kribbella sp. NPDC056951 TaxID=3345978 RepID=UPI0036335DD8
MAERNSWAVSDSPNGVITTEDARLAVSALIQSGTTSVTSRDGIRAGSGDPGLVAAATPTPDKVVTVQPFQMFMRASRGIGSYVQTLDSVKTLDLLTDNPAHSSDARIDLIIVQQADKFYGDTSNAFAVKQIVGTPSSTPGEPGVPGSPDYFLLATVRIPGGATTITPEMITDRRPNWVVGLGGVVPVKNVEGRNAAAPYDGLTAYRRDRRWLEIHDGAAWRVPSIPVCSSVAEITATITDPVIGQMVFSTTDQLIYKWTGSAWLGAVPTGTTRHEARYEVRPGQEQAFAASTDTRLPFPTSVYTSPDITPSSGNTIFTLNRAGIWNITTNARFRAPGGADAYHFYLAIVDAGNLGIRYGNAQHYLTGGSTGNASVSATNLFTAGTRISALIWTTATTANGRTHLTDAVNINNLTLTWLRP